MSISSTHHSSFGILWKDADQPLQGALHSAVDYYQGILQLMELIPNHLPSILIETDTLLAPRGASVSSYILVDYAVSSEEYFSYASESSVTFVDLQPITVQFSNKLSRNRMIPSHISNLEIGLLWRS